MFQTNATNQYASCISHDALALFSCMLCLVFVTSLATKSQKIVFLLIPLTPISLTTAMEIEK